MPYTQILLRATQAKIPSMSDEGRLYCAHLIQSQGLKRILEIGTGHGIWAISMAQANPEVRIITIEKDIRRGSIAQENIQSLNLQDRITVIIEDACEVIVDGLFDLILIDGPKSQNKVLFERFLPQLMETGFILIDNLDFHGETVKDASGQSRDLRQLVRKINAFGTWLQHQPDLSVQRVDVGDGLMLVSRKYPR